MIDITYDFIMKYIDEKIYPRDIETDKANIERIKDFCRLGNLSKQEIKKVAMKLKQKGIAISSMGHGKLRIVTHLDYKEVMHEYVMEVFSKLSF